MATLFSASNFVIVSSTVDFGAGSTANGLVYECPANKYCDFMIRNLRAITNNASNISITAHYPDGIGGYVNSESYLANIAFHTLNTNNPAGLYSITSDSIIDTPASYTSPNDIEHRVSPLGSVSVGSDDRTIWGVKHGPVRLLAGDRIVFSGTVNAGGTYRIVYKAIEYSST